MHNTKLSIGKICNVYDFHVRWVFLPRVSESRPSRLRRGWYSETSGEKFISHGTPYKMHFIAYFTLQGTLAMLNTLRQVEDHENHVRWIYLTTVHYMGESQKYARICVLQPISTSADIY